WKYADIGSTPLKPPANYDASPSRRGPLPNSSSPPPRAVKSPTQSPSKPAEEGPEEEEEQGFDLSKYVTSAAGLDLIGCELTIVCRGFQSIGAYHAPVSRGLPIARARDDES